MPPHHARSGVCRSDATRSGLATRTLASLIGGASRRLMRDFTASAPLGDAGTLTTRLRGARPALWSTLQVTMGGEVVWGGTITAIEAVPVGANVLWDVTATDWHWLLRRYAPVRGQWRDLALNTIAAQIIAGAANGGFLPGFLDSAMGSASQVVFSGETVPDALSKIATLGGGFWRVRPNKAIDVGQSFPDGAVLTINNSTWPVFADSFSYADSGDQVRTRVRMVGRGAQTTAQAQFGAATIPVEECRHYSGATGAVRYEYYTITYTGTTAMLGPGSLTGCTWSSNLNAADPLPQGAELAPMATAEDVAAQTALAAAIGGGASGVAEVEFQVEDDTIVELAARAARDLAFYKTSIVTLGFDRIDGSARYHLPGDLVTVNLTTPFALSGSYRLQQVETSVGEGDSTSYPNVRVRCTARVARKADVLDLMVGS